MSRSDNARYAIACRTPWFWDTWSPPDIDAQWLEIREPAGLDLKRLEQFAPRYVFFPHWSRIVPEAVFSRFECVCFHSTPVPYGRGGSPIQNMIARGHDQTCVTALRMTEDLDAGPVYLQRPVSLLGGGDEIFMRIGATIVEMIEEMVARQPEPSPQTGEPVFFKRRRPHQSALPPEATLEQLFDHIRMLDAEGYPHAFVDHGDYRITFTRPALRRGHIDATVEIRLRDDE